MARMIPPFIDESVKSSGEKQFFQKLQNAPSTEHWIVLHSLNLSEHIKRIFGEIDFLILIPGKGIFVAELKSGKVECKNGVWIYTNRFGKKNSSPVGPFNQARDGMFSLKNYIEKQFGKKHRYTRLLFGFCVILPHVSFNITTPEFESWQVYDRDSEQGSLVSFFDMLSSGFQKKYEQTKWFDPVKSIPDAEDVTNLLAVLRGDFERIYTWTDRLNDNQRQQKILTEEQYTILDALKENKRCLFQGGAGSGKTSLAIESARRSFYGGKKTLLICFNNLLSFWIEKELTDQSSYVQVYSFHRLLRKITDGIDLSAGTGMSEQKFHNEFLPNVALKVLRSGLVEKYDRLIVDEGQDLILEDNLEILDLLLDGGLKSGNWQIYADFDQQAIYARLSKDDMVGMISGYAIPTMFKLTFNCRNTIRIGNETTLVTGSEKQSFLSSSIEGEPVEYIFYNSPDEEKSKLTSKIISLKNDLDISYDRITVLSPRAYHKTIISEIKEFGLLNVSTNFHHFSIREKVRFCTIHSFKGLESDLIILADIEHIDNQEFRSLLYVGMTRARYGLIVCTHDHNKPVLKNILSKHAAKL